MVPGVNIIGSKRQKRKGVSISPSGGLRGWSPSPLKKCLGSKEHQDWLKIDLNAAKTIPVQNYKRPKK